MKGVCESECACVCAHVPRLWVCVPKEPWQGHLAGALHGGVTPREMDGPAGHGGLSIPRKTADA